jgi:hypothetical protein
MRRGWRRQASLKGPGRAELPSLLPGDDVHPDPWIYRTRVRVIPFLGIAVRL